MNPRAYWAGLPVALSALGQPAPFAYRRARGVDPSTSEASFPRSLFYSLSVALDSRRFDPLPFEEPSAFSLPLDVPTLAIPVERPPYMGDLLVVQGDGSEQRIVRARALYRDQVLVATPGLEDPLVVVTFSDIRKWWENYGEVTRDWNRRTGPGRVLSKGFGYQVRILASAVGNHTQTRFSPIQGWWADTVQPDGTPVSLRDIAQFLLLKLPGKLRIVRWPEGVGEGENAPEVRCWAARPKEVLRGLLDAFRLSLDIGPDLRARIYGPGEGSIGELPDGGPENLSSWDPESGDGPWASRITADGNRYARRPTGAPTQVVVVGDRTVYDVQQDFCTPVLCYPLEREGEPPETVVLEVTPRSLAALARGVAQPEQIEHFDPDGPILTDPVERAAVNVLMGADAPPIPDVVETANLSERNRAHTATRDLSGLTAEEQQAAKRDVGFSGAQPAEPARATQADPFAWQRLPLLDDDAFETAYEWMPLGVRKLLREQLWRYWQVPTRRLCPLLKRAERTLAGERLEVQVEAFTFRPVRFQRLLPKDTAEADAKREAQLRVLKWILDGKARMEEALERLRGPTATELAVTVMTRLPFYTPLGLGAIGVVSRQWPFAGEGSTPAAQIVGEEGYRRAMDALHVHGRKWSLYFMPLARVAGVDGKLAEVMESLGKDIPETREARVDALEKGVATYTDAAERLFAELEPRAALVKRIQVVEAKIAAARAASGEDPPGLVAERTDLSDKLASLVQSEKDRRRAEARPNYEPRTRHENLSRVPVTARVVDAELGIIEILSALPPGWIADTSVEDAAQSYLIPMPVRVTFGSWNQRDFEGRGEDRSGVATLTGGVGDFGPGRRVPVRDPHQPNPYMEAAAQMLAGLPDDARAFVGQLGHVVPAENGQPVAGPGQYRLELSREGADAEQYQWLVVMEESPPFRELVRLDGSSNRAELDARARPIAQALLDTPDETDAGSLTLAHPVSVGTNGRISAVEVRLVDAGAGFVTEVSFDGDEAPLPGIVGRSSEGGPVRLTFGLDVDAGRDR